MTENTARVLNFYYLEGCDGSGKTTFSQKLLKELQEGKSPSGETDKVYPEIVKFPSKYPETPFKHPMLAVLFYMTDFLETLIRITEDPNYNTYIFDRSFISTIIYQGYDIVTVWNSQDKDTTIPINKITKRGRLANSLGIEIFSNFKDNIIVNHNLIFLDTDPEECYNRLYKRLLNGGEVLDSTDKKIQTIQNHRLYNPTLVTDNLADKLEKELINHLRVIRAKYVHTVQVLDYLFAEFRIFRFQPKSISCDFFGYEHSVEGMYNEKDEQGWLVENYFV